MDVAAGQDILKNIVVLFFIGNEGLSIVENAAKAGLPISENLKSTLKQYQEQKEAKRA